MMDMDNKFAKTKYEDTEIYRIYKMYLDNSYERQKRLFDIIKTIF